MAVVASASIQTSLDSMQVSGDASWASPSDHGGQLTPVDPGLLMGQPSPNTDGVQYQQQVFSAQPYCICRGIDDGRPMVGCSKCEDWFHLDCVNLTQEDAEAIEEYVCPTCTEVSPDQENRKSSSEATVQPTETSNNSSEKPSAGRKRASEGDLSSSSNKKAKAGRKSESGPSSSTAGRKASVAASPKGRASISESELKKAKGAVPAKEFAASSSAQSGSKADQQTKDPVRVHAINQFNTVLEHIFRTVTLDPSSPTVASVSMEMLQTPVEQRAKAYGQRLEAAMWASYSEPHPKTKLPSAGKAYRDRLRTVLFNLKDKNNNTLHARIATAVLEPEILATLPSDELANDALRQAVEKAKRESLEQSILKKDDRVPLRKITHKGEEDIEIEVGNQMHTREEPRPRPEEQELQSASKSTTIDAGASTSDSGAADSPRHTDLRSPLKIETRDSPLPRVRSTDEPKSAGMQGPKSTTPAGSPSISQGPSFDFTNVFSAPQASSGDEDDGMEIEGSDHEDAEQSEEPAPAAPDWEGSGEVDADDILDALDGPAEAQLEEQDQNEFAEQPADQPIRESTPSLPSQPVWSGAFTMPDEATFSGTAKQIAGRPLGLDRMAWEFFFPVPHATFDGRLPSKVASDYLVECNAAQRTELIVLTFEPSLQLNALAAAGDEAPLTESANVASYDKLLQYLHGRQRYGVIPPSSFARGKIIKDFYIASQLKDEPLPPWLEPLEPKGLREGEPKDIFLLVAVLNRGTLEAEIEATKQSEKAAREAEAAAQAARAAQRPAHAMAPQRNINAILPGGGAALQSLLQAVGSGAAADRTMPAPGAQGNMQMPQAPAPSGGNQLAPPTAAALQQMPTAQLETFLHSNPAVVDQLLNSLKANGGIKLPGGPSGSRLTSTRPPMPSWPDPTSQGMPNQSWLPMQQGWAPPQAGMFPTPWQPNGPGMMPGMAHPPGNFGGFSPGGAPAGNRGGPGRGGAGPRGAGGHGRGGRGGRGGKRDQFNPPPPGGGWGRPPAQ